jgi:4-diphosphocytidyl-2-C-methyl-D-erythritol kinase
VRCDVADLNGEDNLVQRAARLLRAHCPGDAGARITLRKGIPLASGLGGGSSDAAATLRALNKLWGAGLAPSELRTLGASLGSDVPFFVEGGTALARGRGELVAALPPLRNQWFVVARPPLDLLAKTAAMYAMLPPSEWTPGRATAHLAAALKAGRSLREAALFNAFSNTAAATFPEIGTCRQDLLEAAWARPVLAGAGPSLFILVSDRAQAEAVVASVAQGPCRAWVAHSVAAGQGGGAA